jgi:multidrug efflux system membrane fusion protein
MSTIRSLALTALAACLGASGQAQTVAPTLSAVPARVATSAASSAFDGIVEAVRQAVVAAPVAGAVVRLEVKAGDSVKADQVLLRIDSRAADQNAAASDAQVQAARAALDAAAQEYERQKQLFQKNYISQAALERAESTFKATRAGLAAQGAQAGAARTESGLHVVRAPFAGVVSELPVSLGDMAMPGRPLLTLYDPTALRITAAVPQTVAARVAAGQVPRAEFPGLPAARRWLTPLRLQVLPSADPATHTVQMRLELPPGSEGLVPGMFARIWLPIAADIAGAAPANVSVPLQAIVRRAEMTGVYVLDAAGRPALRQVRLGRVSDDGVEVLSGLMPGERVATDPQAAARAR